MPYTTTKNDQLDFLSYRIDSVTQTNDSGLTIMIVDELLFIVLLMWESSVLREAIYRLKALS